MCIAQFWGISELMNMHDLHHVGPVWTAYGLFCWAHQLVHSLWISSHLLTSTKSFNCLFCWQCLALMHVPDPLSLVLNLSWYPNWGTVFLIRLLILCPLPTNIHSVTFMMTWHPVVLPFNPVKAVIMLYFAQHSVIMPFSHGQIVQNGMEKNAFNYLKFKYWI